MADPYSYFSDPRYKKLPAQEKNKVIRGETTLDDYEFTDLTQPTPPELIKEPEPLAPVVTEPEMRATPETWGDKLAGVTIDPVMRGLYGSQQGDAIVAATLGADPNEIASDIQQIQRKADLYEMPEDRQRGLQAIVEADDPWSFLKAAAASPLAVQNVVAESIGMMARDIPVQVAAGFTGPLGLAGATGLTSAKMEYGASLTEALRESGADLTDAYKVSKLLADEEFLAKAQEKATNRGVAVGVFDALTAGLAGKILQTARKGASLGSLGAKATGEAGVQATGGTLGEVAAQLASDGELGTFGSYAIEGLAEVPSAAVEAPSNIRYAREQADRKARIKEEQDAIDSQVDIDLGGLGVADPVAREGILVAREMQEEANRKVQSEVFGKDATDTPSTPEDLTKDPAFRQPVPEDVAAPEPSTPPVGQEPQNAVSPSTAMPEEDVKKVAELETVIKEATDKRDRALTAGGRQMWSQMIDQSQEEIKQIKSKPPAQETVQSVQQAPVAPPVEAPISPDLAQAATQPASVVPTTPQQTPTVADATTPFEPVVTKVGKNAYSITTPSGITTMKGMTEEEANAYADQIRNRTTTATVDNTATVKPAAPTPVTQDPVAKTEIGQIHQAKRAAGLDDAAYRNILEQVTGKTSAKELTQEERVAVTEALKSPQDFVSTPENTAEGAKIVQDVERQQEITKRVGKIQYALQQDKQTKDQPNIEIVTKENLPEGMNETDQGQYDPVTGKIYLNADDPLTQEAPGAVALHEIAHPFDQNNMKTGRASVDNLVGEANRKPLIAAVEGMAKGGSSIALEALTNAQGKPEEVLAHFIEAAKRAKGSNKNIGRRAQQLLSRIFSAIKGYLKDKGVGNFKVTEADIMRAAEIMAKSYREQGGAKPSKAGGAPLKSSRNEQTNTPAFKEWFGDSKVVDENGNPQVVYHGTSEDFSVFDNALSGGTTNALSAKEGFFFSANPAHAAAFATNFKSRTERSAINDFLDAMDGQVRAEDKSTAMSKVREAAGRRDAAITARKEGITDGANVMPTYLSIQNPLVLNTTGRKRPSLDAFLSRSLREAKASGKDGVIIRGLDDSEGFGGQDVYVVFSPNQIKSATGNSGEFSKENPSILKSSRPAQPKAQERAKSKLPDEVKDKPRPESVAISKDPTILGNTPDDKSSRTFGEGKGTKLGKIAMGLASQIANVDRTVFEAIKQGRGKLGELIADASQARYNTLKAIKRDVNRGSKGMFPSRDTALRLLRKKGIEKLLHEIASGEDRSGKALDELSRDFPSTANAWKKERATIDDLTVEMMKFVANKPGGLNNRDIAVLKKMREDMGFYLTRQYRVFQNDKVRFEFIDKINDEAKEYSGKGLDLSDIPKDKQTFEVAKNWIKSHIVDIGEFKEVIKTAREDLDIMSLGRLQNLYEMWVPHDQRSVLPSDSTVEQREVFVKLVTQQLLDRKNSMTNAEYLVELEEKAIVATKDLLESFRDTNESNTLKEYFNSLRGEGGVMKKRSKVPEPIRRLMGEIIEPVLQIHQTHVAMARELSRLDVLYSVYESGKWIDSSERKGEKADIYNKKLSGDKFGPLQGKYVTQQVHDQLDMVETLNSSLDSFLKAQNNSQVKAGTTMVAQFIGDSMQKVSTAWKVTQIVLNTFSAAADFASTTIAIAGDGHIPYANWEATKFAFGAAYHLISVANRGEMSASAREVLRNHMQDSAQYGEIQEADFQNNLKAFRSNFSTKKEMRTFFERFLKDPLIKVKDITSFALHFTTDLKAMSDLVGKFYNYSMEKQFQRALDKAKKEDDPSYKMRSDRQIQVDASAIIDDTNIGYHRAAPAGKYLDRWALGLLLNFFTETARTGGNKFRVANRYIDAADAATGTAEKKLLSKRASQRWAGAVVYAGANRAMMYASVALLPMIAYSIGDDEEKEQVDRNQELIELYRSSLHPAERSRAWILPKVVNGKLWMFDASRFDVAGVTTQIAVDAAEGISTGDKELIDRAVEAPASLLITQPVLGKLWRNRTPSMAKSDPAMHKELRSLFGNDTGDFMANLYDSMVPRQARQVRQVFAEGSPASELDWKRKAALIGGASLRVFDPKYDLPNSTFDYLQQKNEQRDSIREAISLDNKSKEDFEKMYLEFSQEKIKESAHVLANIALARSIGANDETIVGALTKGVVGKRGGGLSEPEALSLVDGKGYPIVLEPEHLKESEKKEIAEVEGNTDIDEYQREILTQQITNKYDKYIQIIDDLNSVFDY